MRGGPRRSQTTLLPSAWLISWQNGLRTDGTVAGLNKEVRKGCKQMLHVLETQKINEEDVFNFNSEPVLPHC